MLFNHKDESGQGMVEYGLIIILVAMVVMIALTNIPPPVAQVFSEIGQTLSAY